MDLDKFVTMGERMGLKGEALKTFVREEVVRAEKAEGSRLKREERARIRMSTNVRL